ncbi:MAG: ECF transporter S component [Chloroflexi bacterium HGW-Chloroflexi-6]|nr:MAG: ECF transporter S component [Chloroflexi bacterium HGW-Chloroflexi-6]
MSLKEQLKKDFSTITLALMAVGIVLNIILGQVVSLLKLPIFLDSIGTVIVALLAGPWAGGLTGLLTNLIWGMISDPVAAAFAPVAMIIGIVAGLCAKYGLFKSWWQAIISGVIISLALSVVAIPIRVYMFGGVTGSGADFITAYLLAAGRDLFSAVIITVVADNLIDKVVTGLLAWGIVKGLPKRFSARFSRASAVTE